MKIVQVQTQAEMAGAQRVSDMVGEGLRARGHDVRCVFMYRKTDAYDRDPNADFILTHRPRGPLDLARACIGLVSYMRSARPDAVISYQHYGNIFGTIAGRLAGARRLIANQSGPPSRRGMMGLATWIDRLMGRWGAYDFSIVNSGWTEAQFAQFPQAYRRRLRRIDHGVARSAGAFDKQAARRAFSLPGEAFIVVSTGRLTELKNQRALIEAMTGLPGVHLALAGVGPQEPSLRHLVADRGLTARVHFAGEVPSERVFEFLAAGDMFAFASRSETFGLSVAEAAIAGLPVVANDLPVLREVLSSDDGPAALFADAVNVGELVAAIEQIKAQPDLAARLARAGRCLADKYSPDAMCRAYEALVSD